METNHYQPRPCYRTALICFTLGVLAGILADDLLRSTYAQIPNAGQQRQEINVGMQQLNGTMSEVLTVLRTGTLKVRIIETDKTTGNDSRGPSDRAVGTSPRLQSSSSGGGSGRSGR